MNTFLSDGQQKSKEVYEGFAREQVAPKAVSLDSRSLPLKEFLSDISHSGYLGLTVPQEYGGKQLPFLDAVLLIEAVSKHEPGLGFTLAVHTAAVELLVRYGSDTQKSRYLPLLARGETLGTLAFNEAGAGTDVFAAETSLEKNGEKYIVTGSKTWVVNGDAAGLVVVMAKEADGNHSLMLLETGTPGVRISANTAKLGLRSASAVDMNLDRVEVPAANVLGTAGGAHEQVSYALDLLHVLLGAVSVGIAEGLLDISAEHARNRTQFGQSIGQYQAIQWKLADNSADSSAARLLVYRAAWSKDEEPSELRRYAAMCKWFAARAARIHSGEAVQILGASGLDEGSASERLYRDAKTAEIAAGTPEFQKLLLVEELKI